MAPCGCSGDKNKPVDYVFTNTTTGTSQTYRTEVEARAAKIRAGGQGTVTTVAK